MHSPRLLCTSLLRAFPLILSIAAVDGCGTDTLSVAPSITAASSTPAYTLSGAVHLPTPPASPQDHPHTALPIANATVYLYAAGTGGYGSPATLLAETTTSTDGNGSFSFRQDGTHTNSYSSISSTYACPEVTFTSPDGHTSTVQRDAYIYLIAAGGDTLNNYSATASSNSASVLMAALGDCATLAASEPFVNVTEVTTAASIFALAPYISPIYPTATINGLSTTLIGGALGTSTSYLSAYGSPPNGGYTSTGLYAQVAITPVGYTALANAFATAGNLISLSTGTAVASFTTSNAGAGVSLKGVPEQAKLNHLADILSTCVESSNTGASVSSRCSSMFALTPPPISASTTSLGSGFTFPAAQDTLQSALYMALNPTDNTTYGASTSSASSNLTTLFNLVTPHADFTPDLNGQAQPTDWTLSIAYTSSSICGTDSTKGAFLGPEPWLAVTDLNGNVAVLNGYATNNTLFQLSNAGTPLTCQLGNFNTGRGLVYDTFGGLWGSGNFAGGVFHSSQGSTSAPTSWPTSDGSHTYTPYAIAADGLGNVFYSVPAYPIPVTAASVAELQEYLGVQGPTSGTRHSGLAGATFATGAGESLFYLASDNAGDIASPASGGDTMTGAFLWPASTSNGTLNSIAITASSSPAGVAYDSAGNLFTANQCCSDLQAFKVPITGSGATLGAGATTASGFATAGILGASSLALDGAGNLWVSNAYAAQSSAGAGIFSLSELDNNLNPLSPNGNATGACSSTSQTTGCNLGGGFQKASLGPSRGIAIDTSGNIWIAADLTPNGISNGTLVEIIGAAVPTVQPLALANRDQKLATLP